jgi:hypothetical protein
VGLFSWPGGGGCLAGWRGFGFAVGLVQNDGVNGIHTLRGIDQANIHIKASSGNELVNWQSVWGQPIDNSHPQSNTEKSTYAPISFSLSLLRFVI